MTIVDFSTIIKLKVDISTTSPPGIRGERRIMKATDLLKHTPPIEDLQDPDAHSCRAEASPYGICQWCGAIVSGTTADYELHGYDPY